MISFPRHWPCLFLLAVCVSASAQSEQALQHHRNRSIAAQHATVPPVLDGLLDDDVWKDAEVIRDFHQVDPEEFAAPAVATEVRVAFDADNLYIGARLEHSERSRLVANVMVQALRVTPDERLMIVLDPLHDRRNGYFFEINANGLRGDALLENNRTWIQEWSGIWYTATNIENTGTWTVEVRIPLATLSFDPSLDTWGINFLRDVPGYGQVLAWSSAGTQDFQVAPAYAGELTGLSGMRKGIGIDVTPGMSLRRRDDRVHDKQSLQLRPSLDVTYKLGEATTAALTVNTDFTSTEPDDRQVNLTRYSLFVPEKRSFFLQDAGIFEFGDLSGNGRPFFSRTIGLAADGTPVDLEGGLKVTGRDNGWNYGLLAVRQDSSANVSAQTLAVGRLVRSIGTSTSLGAILTDGDPRDGGDSRTLGVDLRSRTEHFGDAPLEGEIWWQRSSDSLPGDANDAFGVGLHYPSDTLSVNIRAAELQADFRPAMGFVNRTDVRAYSLNTRYRWRDADGPIYAYNVYFNRVWTERIGGGIESDKWTFVPFAPWNPKIGYMEWYFDYEREVPRQAFDLFDRLAVPAGDYAGLRTGIFFETREASTLSATGDISRGPFLGGTRDETTVAVTWRANSRVAVKASASINDVTLPSGHYIARLLSSTASIALSSKLAWITVAQYDNVSNDLGLDTRLRYTPQAGQELAFIYTHGASDAEGRFRRSFDDAVLRASYTLRY